MMSETRRRRRWPIVLCVLLLLVLLGAGKWGYYSQPDPGPKSPRPTWDAAAIRPGPKQPWETWDGPTLLHRNMTLMPFHLMATTTAEIASAHLIIQQIATSADAANDLARERYEDVKKAYNSFCRDRWEDMHYQGEPWNFRYQEQILRPADEGWAPMSAGASPADEDDLFMSQIDVDVLFTDLRDLHRFHYHYISPNTNWIAITELFWGLQPETTAKVNEGLEDAARGPVRDYIADGFEMISLINKEEDGKAHCKSKHYSLSKYMSRRNTPTDFESPERIQEFFAGNPDVSEIEPGQVQSVYAVQCMIQPVEPGTGEAAEYPPKWMKNPV